LNLGASAIVLRPRSVSEVVDLACRVCFSLAFGLYARLSAVVLLPLFVGLLVLRSVADLSWAIMWPLTIAAVAIVEGIFTVAASRLVFETIGARAVLRLYGKRLGAFLGSLVIRALALLISPLTFFIALPFFAIRMLFLDEACLLEGLSGGRALERAQRLVQGRGGIAFQVILAHLVARAAFVLVADLLFQGLVDELFQLGQPFGSLLGDGGSPAALAGYLLSGPFIATARFLQYIDTRTRADGWDIQLRFTAIRAREDQERMAA
jgi:hypothetical protein